ncbi:hypothetical protein NBRC116593_26520 [Sulfitobacter pacificus]
MIYCKKGESVFVTETVFDDETGLPTRQLTTLNGVLQSPPNDTPARVVFDDLGRICEMAWYSAGQEHRDLSKGPAVVEINPDNGICISERFKIKGNTSRSRSEPALLIRNEETGDLIGTAYYLDGVEIAAPKPATCQAALVPKP